MSAPASPARHSWLLWIAMLFLLTAAASVPLVIVRPAPEEPQPPMRKYLTRQQLGRIEVFVLTPDAPEGVWLPVVTATDSPLVGLVPEQLTVGEVVHLNADGTAIITDHAAASARSGREAGGLHGWPPAQGKWASPPEKDFALGSVSGGRSAQTSSTADGSRHIRISVAASPVRSGVAATQWQRTRSSR